MIYHVGSERISIEQRVARVLLFPVIYVTVIYAWHLFSPWRKSDKVSFDWLDVSINVAVAFFFDSVRKEYDLEVSDEIICKKGSFFSNSTVRKGRIRYLHERSGNILLEPGLLLSEGGPVRRFFSGSVFIPASLPEYEQIKTKAMSWMQIG